MRGGNLRTPITIRRAIETQSATGDYDTTWVTIASPYAQVEGLDGREMMMARALQGVSSYRVTIRYRDGILADDQIHFTDVSTLNITSVADPDGRRRTLVILAETGTTRSEI
jgi:SPP1 family predicted phage head-tail adaptor